MPPITRSRDDDVRRVEETRPVCEADEGIQRTFQAFVDALPDGRVGMGYGWTPENWRALERLAFRNGYLIDCVGYSGVLDYQLLPLADCPRTIRSYGTPMRR
jgi:hypothetical protein